MRCYKCDSVLSDNDFCNSCGADVTVYKKIVRLSNSYYNMGLAKAKIRDLTGACEFLRRSVKLDKKNTQARNLLGLVYFEMGEAVQALSEWVISKNLEPKKNLANEYIKRLQANAVRLDTISQTIKKYNVALNYAKQGSDDLAVIQLKKVLNTNPNLIKGHLLLALLYMKKGDYERAKKPIMKTLKIDANNPLAKKYLEEVNNQTEGKKIEQKRSQENRKGIRDYEQEQIEKELAAGYDIALPKRRMVYRESNSGFMTVLNVIIGIVIGVAMTFFLLIPAKEKSLNETHNKEILKLNSQIDTLNNEKKELESQKETLESEKSDLSVRLDSKGNENNEVISDYDNLISAVNSFNAKDFVGCSDKLKSIQNTARSEVFSALYGAIQPEAFKEASNACYKKGKDELSKASSLESYDEVINDLKNCFSYDYMQTDYIDAAEKLGEAYEKQYKLALETNIEEAGKYKEKALNEMTELINKLTSEAVADNKAAQNLQVHINNIRES